MSCRCNILSSQLVLPVLLEPALHHLAPSGRLVVTAKVMDFRLFSLESQEISAHGGVFLDQILGDMIL